MAKKKNTSQKELDPRIKLISKKIKKLRIEAGYSNYENFAWENGISRIQYWKVESGQANLTLTSLFKILDAHNMTLAEFFADVEG